MSQVCAKQHLLEMMQSSPSTEYDTAFFTTALSRPVLPSVNNPVSMEEMITRVHKHCHLHQIFNACLRPLTYETIVLNSLSSELPR